MVTRSTPPGRRRPFEKWGRTHPHVIGATSPFGRRPTTSSEGVCALSSLEYAIAENRYWHAPESRTSTRRGRVIRHPTYFRTGVNPPERAPYEPFVRPSTFCNAKRTLSAEVDVPPRRDRHPSPSGAGTSHGPPVRRTGMSLLPYAIVAPSRIVLLGSEHLPAVSIARLADNSS